MVGAIAEGSGNSLFAMPRATQEKQEESLDQTAQTSLAPAVSDTLALSKQGVAASDNMMSRNFSSAQREESPYIAAIKGGFAADEQLTLSRNQVIVASVAKAIAESAYWNGNERMRQSKMMKDSVESNEGALQEIKETTEQMATESGADAAGGTQQGAAPAPTISGSTPAPAPDVVATPTPTVSASVVDVAAPSAPSAPSVDIIV